MQYSTVCVGAGWIAPLWTPRDAKAWEGEGSKGRRGSEWDWIGWIPQRPVHTCSRNRHRNSEHDKLVLRSSTELNALALAWAAHITYSTYNTVRSTDTSMHPSMHLPNIIHTVPVLPVQPGKNPALSACPSSMPSNPCPYSAVLYSRYSITITSPPCYWEYDPTMASRYTTYDVVDTIPTTYTGVIHLLFPILLPSFSPL